MDDQDSVRVDLLKFRRKAFLSYPEGSPERKTFLKVILQNELRITENEMPQDFMNLVLEGSTEVLKDTLKNVLILLGILFICSYTFIELWPKIHFLAVIFLIGGVGCIIESGLRIKNYFSYRKSMEVVKQYSNDIKKQMNRISNDIKRLDGPHGL